MKFSYNWLRDLVDALDTPPRELAQLITLKTAECEGVEAHGTDSVIEIDNKSLTHRPDLWGHYGMAREVAAILGRKLVDPVKPAQFPGSAPVRVSIEDHALCPRYSALVFENVTVKPSPAVAAAAARSGRAESDQQHRRRHELRAGGNRAAHARLRCRQAPGR